MSEMMKDEYQDLVDEMLDSGFSSTNEWTMTFACANCAAPAHSDGFIHDRYQDTQRYREFVVCDACGHVQEI